jgi:dTDP-glucose 4,6-dehydratase
MTKNILITGGAGFIGSHVVRRFVNKYENYHIYNLDALTYAGNLENLIDIEKKENYTFIKGDISDEVFINKIFKKYKFEQIIHLAAESHVDRSIVTFEVGLSKTIDWYISNQQWLENTTSGKYLEYYNKMYNH